VIYQLWHICFSTNLLLQIHCVSSPLSIATVEYERDGSMCGSECECADIQKCASELSDLYEQLYSLTISIKFSSIRFH
jgi:hypothetical protein